MERKWRKSKYSVNSETSIRKDEDEEKANYNVKIDQLATHKSKSEDKKNVNTEISVLQHQPSTQHQLTASETGNCSSNNKEASSITAKQGKSIIPAHSKFKNSSNDGSPNYTDYTDSIKALGPIDNTLKNTYLRTITRTYANIKYNKINPTDPTLNPKTNPNLTNLHPAIISETYSEPKTRNSYKQNPIKNKGQLQGRDKILTNTLVQKMAPKIIKIHARNMFILLVKLKCKIAPKIWQIRKLITSAEQILKMAPKIMRIHIRNLNNMQAQKMAPKIMQIHARNTLVPLAKLKNKFASKCWQITKLITSAEQDLKLAPKNIWIQNLIILPKYNINLAQIIDWINDILESAELKYNFAPRCWQITKSITSAEQNPKLAPKATQIRPINILVKSDKSRYKIAPKTWWIIKLIAIADLDLKLAPKSIWIHDPITLPESNINLAHRISCLDLKLAPKAIWIQNLTTLPKSNINLVQITVRINDILESAEPKYNFAPKCWQIIMYITSAEHNLKLALKTIQNQPIHILLLMLNNNLTLTTMIVIHRHYDNRIETDYNKPTLVITELYHLTITITAAQPLPTKLLIQTFFFIIHAGSTGTTDEWTNCKVTTNSVTGAQSQHSRQTLIDVVPTPGKPKTTLKRNKNCEWKGRPRETKGTKGMKGTKGRGIAMKTYMNEKENQKKIIFYTFINIFSCLINIHSCFTSYNISCNILCNVPVDIRLRTQVSEKEIKCRLMVDSKGIGKDMGSLKNFCKSQTTRTPIGVEPEKKSTLCGKQALPINLGNTIPTYMVGESLSTHLVWEEVSFSKLKIFNCFFQPYRTQSKLTSNLDILHTINYIKAKLMNDIESNPGPGEKLKIITLNCRGLGEIDKFRLLLNKAYDIMQKNYMIMMIQETMITNSRYLDLAWRGKYVFTPGTGNSQGCITLTNNDVTITDIEHVQNRGHYFKLTDMNNMQTLIVNIYAPLGYNNAKKEFFDNILEVIANHDGENVILGGDFNITLTDMDSLRRRRTDAEKQIAENINTRIAQNELSDAFHGKIGYTWGRGETRSRLDRIFTRLPLYKHKNLDISWTLAKSDHAAVILTLEHKHKIRMRNEHVKLDNSIVTNTEHLHELKQYLEEQMAQTVGMDPHTKLEFVKMTIRTKAIEINMRLRKKENIELKDLNDQISRNTEILQTPLAPNNLQTITRELEECKQKRDIILQRQGENLSMKAKTRWYNEGEKSNKYFLNLLKRNSESSEMTKLNINGITTTDENEIREGVTKFYTELYNNGTDVNIDNNFLDEMFEVQQHFQDNIHAPITLDEMWNTIRSVRATTPGPDGISNLYIKKLWYILGPVILDAWNYSLETNNLPPSHKTSLLRLIPKKDKDTTLIKNWRPITLSNCDHKLITRLYNNRILKAIENEITSTQTAYIKGRNISDNLRLLGAAVKLAENEDDINATIIALDAQKAFDSVNHNYINAILDRTGLHNFKPIFQLLYKDLSNDIIINGKIGKGYALGNGVKQGDALSCSLFILAMEPLLRNIARNNTIKALKSRTIDYTWPKIVGYADDVTIITENSNSSVKQIFHEYERLTNASGLKLNADKTEKLNITSPNIAGALASNNVIYCDTRYLIQAQDDIKINGVIFNQNEEMMKKANFEIMKTKMDRHFTEWSKRGLSLLGKIQIVKTFGLSQYLYTLAVTEISAEQWKTVNKLIYKFIWNKTYSNNNAPHRIKDTTMHTSIEQGGFGMVKLHDLMIASRIRRYMILLDKQVHPISDLQIKLGAGDHLRQLPKMNLDSVTNTSLMSLYKIELKYYMRDRWLIDTDRVLQNMFMHTKIRHAIADNRHNSIELNMLRLRRINTIGKIIELNNDSKTLLSRIIKPELRSMLEIIDNLYAGMPVPDRNNHPTILDANKNVWLRCSSLTSRHIRLLLKDTVVLNNTKLMTLTPIEATSYYKNVKKISSTQNRTKLMRLMHGDVYCGTRLKEFKLIEFDTCIRCFEKETIKHLLLECPYTQEVWATLGIDYSNTKNVIGIEESREELEVRADFLSSIVFRKGNLPPNTLINMTYLKFSKGLCKNNKVKELAQKKIEHYSNTGRWN